MRLRWTTVASDDFESISQFIERDRDLDTANRVCRRVYDTIQIPRRHPRTARPGAQEGTRELVVPGLPFVVVYQALGSEAVQILNIRHSAQDWR